MDNAEAIKRINDHIRVHHIGEYPHIKIAEALNMAISALATDIIVGHWIPVSERLPEDDLPKGSKVKQIKVLTALTSDKGVRTVRSQMRYRCTWYSNYEPWTWKYSGSEITHWMPLPEPPKE